MWRGGLGSAYLLPALSLAGASIASPCSVSTSGSRRKVHDVAHARLRVRLVRQTKPSTSCREASGNRLAPGHTNLCLAHNHRNSLLRVVLTEQRILLPLQVTKLSTPRSAVPLTSATHPSRLRGATVDSTKSCAGGGRMTQIHRIPILIPKALRLTESYRHF